MNHLNNDLKNSVALKPQDRNLDEIQTTAEEFMAFLSDKPEYISAYFEHEKVVEYPNDSLNDDTSE